MHVDREMEGGIGVAGQRKGWGGEWGVWKYRERGGEGEGEVGGERGWE